jgi:DNA topoisomerase I
MSKSLVIVESPAKIKTLKQFLGSGFLFESSYGHIRDLPESEFGIDIEHDFEPKYVTLPEKKEVISKLKKAAEECDVVYLCPDPDREGEAIAWHISQILPPNTQIKRVAFNALTKDAVCEAIQNPHGIDISLVNAQQARRLLDRLVGYTISPLLNKRLKRGRGSAVSGGRVQSVALKLVVDRERAIEAFIPQEYWTISADLEPSSKEHPFSATLFAIDNIKIEKEPQEGKVEGKDFVLVQNVARAEHIVEDLKNAPYTITRVDRKEKKRNPEAPFITSTLQQEASRHYRFSPARTMEIAQTLYEGIDLGEDGTNGLITYMRTDSVRLAPEAIDAARAYIAKEYGQDLLPQTGRQFQLKKSAQDAHEAIRPANLEFHPEKIKQFLSKDQLLLYTLIWRRFLASQMVPAIYDTVSVDVQAGDHYLLRATGSVLKFPGFLSVYEEKKDEEEEKDDYKLLPSLTEGEIVTLLGLHHDQSFTRPPARFTEASLVKELEKSGIGRPSTYAAIMKKIQSRDYTIKESGRLKPTELGRVITEMLENNFQQIMNIGFTATMEDDLEQVAEAKKEWKILLKDFWDTFSPALQNAEKSAFIPKIQTDLVCPKCGGFLQKVWSKSKYFLGCINYPECDFTSSLEEATFDKANYAEDFDWNQKCPICQSEMKLRFGKFGPFLGCTNYPTCRGIVAIPKKGEQAIDTSQDVHSPCPAIGCTGHLIRRRSRFGKMFYSCSEFPACDVIGNDIDAIKEKYAAREKTAYIKKPKGQKKGTSKKERTGKSKEPPQETGKAKKVVKGKKKSSKTKEKATVKKKTLAVKTKTTKTKTKKAKTSTKKKTDAS